MSEQGGHIVRTRHIGPPSGRGQRGVPGTTGHVEHALAGVQVQGAYQQLTDDELGDADAMESPAAHIRCMRDRCRAARIGVRSVPVRRYAELCRPVVGSCHKALTGMAFKFGPNGSVVLPV